jgi:hypothetical protein
MDKTLRVLSSGWTGDRSAMKVDRLALATRASAKAFAHLAGDNPLGRLAPRDRIYVWALLLLYAGEKGSKSSRNYFEPLEKVHKLAADAAKLAKGIESEIFGGSLSEVLLPFSAKFKNLPTDLADFSTRLGDTASAVGRRGHQQKVFKNLSLIEASEFTRLKTGQHYDEHLAELFQATAAGRRELSEDFSGDAIRKKRVYMAKNYPLLTPLP